jgi:hypothetical protein
LQHSLRWSQVAEPLQRQEQLTHEELQKLLPRPQPLVQPVQRPWQSM